MTRSVRKQSSVRSRVPRITGQREFEREIRKYAQYLNLGDLPSPPGHRRLTVAVARMIQAMRLLSKCIENGVVSRQVAHQFVQRLAQLHLRHGLAERRTK
jgi:hypothetical protein